MFSCAAAQAQNPTASVIVDANANRRAINPNVYGLAYATTAQLTDLNVPLNRYGGNNSSRYNWQVNGDNRDADWYFESIGDSSSVAGERGDTFISNSRAGGAQALITVPMIGWVAKLGASRAKLAVSLRPNTARKPATTPSGFPTPGTEF
jgi:Glycoside hydrolase family 44